MQIHSCVKDCFVPESRVESGDTLPFGESLSRQPEVVGDKSRRFQSLVTPPALKHDTNNGSPTAKAVGDSHNMSSFSSLHESISFQHV
jgi:hypothetical protein